MSPSDIGWVASRLVRFDVSAMSHPQPCRLGLLLADHGWWQVLSRQSCKDTVLNARRERIRPLINRLVGDANSLGGGGHGAPKQFNGFGFLHSPIEPQFTRCCNSGSTRKRHN